MKAKRRTKSPEEVNAALAAKKGPVSKFIARNYRHFNAAALLDAAKGYEEHLAAGGRMLMTLAGAMSTAELGISLAEMIRRDKVHLIVLSNTHIPLTEIKLREKLNELFPGQFLPSREDNFVIDGNLDRDQYLRLDTLSQKICIK